MAYLNALQRFIENDIPLEPGCDAPLLRFVPYPDPLGTCTGDFDKILLAFQAARQDFEEDAIDIWVDADKYVRDDPLYSDRARTNKAEYLSRDVCVPVFRFSYHNFEDFIALHLDEGAFALWKREVLLSAVACRAPHRDVPMARTDYAPRFQKVLPHYSKRRMPFDMSLTALANLRRHVRDVDVRAMAARLQPGISFGAFLLEMFDSAYPGLIP
ncbi:MAG: hypothetical protein ACI4RA_07075 [Kiritimatiellia bacterium]